MKNNKFSFEHHTAGSDAIITNKVPITPQVPTYISISNNPTPYLLKIMSGDWIDYQTTFIKTNSYQLIYSGGK